MNKIRIILITLLVFILLNAIIVFLWPIRTNLKLLNLAQKKKKYSHELRIILKIFFQDHFFYLHKSSTIYSDRFV